MSGKKEKSIFEWPDTDEPEIVTVGDAGLPKPPTRRVSDPAVEMAPTNEETRARLLADIKKSGIVTTTTVPRHSVVDDTVKGYTTRLPVRVKNAVEIRGMEEGRPMNYYILRGLQLQGFPVSDEDLTDKRGIFLKTLAGKQ